MTKDLKERTKNFAIRHFKSTLEKCKSLLKESDELTRIFISSRKTANLNINTNQ